MSAQTWLPVDIESMLGGDLSYPAPSTLPVETTEGPGQRLLYSSRVHLSTSITVNATRMLGLAAIASVLRAPDRRRVAVIVSGEAEEPGRVLSEILAQGVSRDAIRERLDLYAPETCPLRPTRRAGWLDLLTRRYALVSIPSVPDMLRLSDIELYDEVRGSSWMREVPVQLARETQAAVLIGWPRPETSARPSTSALALSSAVFLLEQLQHGPLDETVGYRLRVLKDRLGHLDPQQMPEPVYVRCLPSGMVRVVQGDA